MSAALSLFAAVPRGLESQLAGELRTFGATGVTQVRAGVSFRGSLETAYRCCLWSRLAGRILVPLTSGPAADGDQLYNLVQTLDWSDHLGCDDTLAVDFSGVNECIRDTRYGAVRIKDAIVDQFRASSGGRRPSVDTRSAHVRVNAHLVGKRVTISIDLSGQSLHRRGYRVNRVQVEAPLKENLAAGLLLYAAWPREAAGGGSLLDPLCGSGTLPIEAALIAADIAPGLLRADETATIGQQGQSAPAFGFLRWRGHQPDVWDALLAEARERRAAGIRRLAAARPDVVIRGSDRDPKAVRIAQHCVRRAGLHGLVTISRADLAEAAAPAARGLLAANAPYGMRLSDAGADRGQAASVDRAYRDLGERLKTAFPGWSAVILAGDARQLGALGLSPTRETPLRNGPLECRLAYYDAAAIAAGDRPHSARAAVRSSIRTADPSSRATESPPIRTAGRPFAGPSRPGYELTIGRVDPTAGAEQLANRLRKNQRRLTPRLRREGITCYRLYDADLPEYNLVVDVYGEWAHVQEYTAPAEIDPAKAERRLREALDVVGAVLDVPAERIALTQRRRQRGTAQYERREGAGFRFKIAEDELLYYADLHSYIDTGFFIDQRATRRLVRRLAGGRRFLNLFAYTGTMTVNALAGGSPTSTSVDLSATYLAWAQRNLSTNGFSAAVHAWPAGGGHTPPPATPHRLVQGDCLRWIAEADEQFDLIWLDPPTFSNSKRMGRATFDVRRDHVDLIRMVVRRLLSPHGVLLFAANAKGFRLAVDGLADFHIRDLSHDTLAFDCRRRANRHYVAQIEHRSTGDGERSC